MNMPKMSLSYKVFVTPDRQTGSKKSGYTAFVPKLGVADDGYTIEEALKNVRSLMKFHLESLVAERSLLPAPDNEDALVTSASVDIPAAAVINCQRA